MATGYTFVAVLVLLCLVSLSLSIAGPIASQKARRERERELLRIGCLYARAIAKYHDGSPGSVKRYPTELRSLLRDNRFVGVQRDIRTLYPDPLDPKRPWGIVRDPLGGIMGVYSQSTEAPVATGPVAAGGQLLPPARTYSDWIFLAQVKQ